MYVKKVGVAYDVNKKKLPKGTKVAPVGFLKYTPSTTIFGKNIYTQLDGHARILIKSTRLTHDYVTSRHICTICSCLSDVMSNTLSFMYAGSPFKHR